ncbi:DUF2243 domain-containing protein [Bradyrhizobium yuanmingense]|uniref:DUF2243 domain-containing protein n=1 Tax=Bradyrhizobium TaxID=374 RepID=UPI001CD61963|nr:MULTISPECIES: DUF2243 domain-containing protein [unclassified Bradyrhizobium]MCA1544295.1 DUF2243 domain-containing protein [Bradyrhizobium sp. NBAIM32]UWU87229.1 DUF2243 domain-containing protein [Bradyrhizobium sp. CB1024]
MEDRQSNFPTSACVLLGLGLGAFFDGIVFHQLLQWHHMLSGWYPLNSIENITLNTTWDGIFHSAAYVLVLAGLFLMWQRTRRSAPRWSGSQCFGTILIGWGIFNLAEGVVDHQILRLHQVNETVPDGQRIFWDIGFLLWGAAMIGMGVAMARVGAQEGVHAKGSLQGR